MSPEIWKKTLKRVMAFQLQVPSILKGDHSGSHLTTERTGLRKTHLAWFFLMMTRRGNSTYSCRFCMTSAHWMLCSSRMTWATLSRDASRANRAQCDWRRENAARVSSSISATRMRTAFGHLLQLYKGAEHKHVFLT